MAIVQQQLDEARKFEERCVPYFSALLKMASSSITYVDFEAIFKLIEIENKMFEDFGYFPPQEIICSPEDSVRQITWGGVDRSIYV